METLTAEQFKKKYGEVGFEQLSKKQNFFQDAGSDIKETGSAIKNTISRTLGKVDNIRGALKSKEQGNIRSIGQATGAVAGGISRAVGDAVIGVGKVVLPQEAEDAVARGVEKVATPIMQSGPVQTLMERYNSLGDKSKRDVDAALGITELGLDFLGAGIGKRSIRGGVNKAADVAQQGAEAVSSTVKSASGKVVPLVGETAGSIKDFAISQTTGLSPATIKTIIDNPTAFKTARETGLSRSTLAGQVEETLNKRLDDLGELGKQYEPIRQSGEVATLPAGWFEKELGKHGFILKDGKVRANSKSITRDANDLNAIQKIYDDWGTRGVLEAEEFLNLRHDLSKLSKFGKEVGKSDELENFARAMRVSLNESRDQFTGLKELDNKFAPEVTELSALKKEFLDKDGNLKDTAINRIANATNKGNDPRLERLKKLVPDIEPRIKLLQAIEDVDLAKGQKVGSYTRAVLGGGLLFTGNAPAGIALIAISNPETVIKILGFYADRVKPKTRGLIQGAQKKMREGKKLTPEEGAVVGRILGDKKFLDKALEGIGATTGFGATGGLLNSDPVNQ